MEKDANVSYPKTKCDLCERAASLVVDQTALCKECHTDELRKQAEIKIHDVYYIPRKSD
jgi:hypothetical protein